jgi:transaldolase
MLSTKRWHGDEGRAATLRASLPRLPAGSWSPLESLRLVPGHVSTEVDGNLSFNVAASVARAHQIIDA